MNPSAKAPLWMPISADWVCIVDRYGVVHATKPTIRPQGRRVTADAVCGKRGRHMGVSDGTTAVVVLVWPPKVALLDEGRTRCAECWAQTGKKRPDPSWERYFGKKAS